MTGTMISTASASFQLIMSRRTLAPMIRKNDEMSEAMAWDTKFFIASMSEVRLVSSLVTLFYVGVFLGRKLGGNLGAQVARDALGGVYLRDVLQEAEREHAKGDYAEFNDKESRCVVPRGKGVYAGGDDFRYPQVKGVADERGGDERGDDPFVRDQKAKEPRPSVCWGIGWHSY